MTPLQTWHKQRMNEKQKTDIWLSRQKEGRARLILRMAALASMDWMEEKVHNYRINKQEKTHKRRRHMREQRST
jgi:hypothetical protein